MKEYLLKFKAKKTSLPLKSKLVKYFWLAPNPTNPIGRNL